jgi:hypothetical protein
MPRVMAEQGELLVSLFWSWLAGAINVRKITDGETDRQAYSDKLIQTAFIHWPLLWCMPHLLVLYTDDSCSVALSPTERQRSLHMQNGQDLGEELEKQKGKKRMAANL